MVELRPATPADLDLLRHWDEQPHVEAADPNDDWAWEIELGRNPEWRELLIAELDRRPVGFIQIIDPAREESRYWGEDVPDNLRAIDIWIGEADDLGRGLGTRMMELAIERCFSAPEVTAILIDPLVSNTRAHRFSASALDLSARVASARTTASCTGCRGKTGQKPAACRRSQAGRLSSQPTSRTVPVSQTRQTVAETRSARLTPTSRSPPAPPPSRQQRSLTANAMRVRACRHGSTSASRRAQSAKSCAFDRPGVEL